MIISTVNSKEFLTSTKSIDICDKQVSLHYVSNTLSCEKKAQNYSAVAKQYFFFSKERQSNKKLAKEALAAKQEWLEFEIYDPLKKKFIIQREKLNVANGDIGQSFLSFSAETLTQNSFHFKSSISIFAKVPKRKDLCDIEKSLRKWAFDGKVIELLDLSNEESCKKQVKRISGRASKYKEIYMHYQQALISKHDEMNKICNPVINIEIAILEHLKKISEERYDQLNEEKKKIRLKKREWREIRITDPSKLVDPLMNDLPNIERVPVPRETIVTNPRFFFETDLKPLRKALTEKEICYSEELIQSWLVNDKIIKLWHLSNIASCQKQADSFSQLAFKHEHFCNIYHNLRYKNPEQLGLLDIIKYLWVPKEQLEMENLRRKEAVQKGKLENAVLEQILKISNESSLKYHNLKQKILSKQQERLEIRVTDPLKSNIEKDSIDLGERSVSAVIPYFLKCDPLINSSGFPDFSPSSICEDEIWQDPISLSEDETIQLFWKHDKYIWRFFDKTKKTASWIEVNKDSLVTIRALESVSSEYKKIYLLKCRMIVNKSKNGKLESVSIKFVSKWNPKILLDEIQWAVTLVSIGSSSGRPYRAAGGHAMIFYEGVENGLPFRRYAHLTAADGPPRVEDIRNASLGEKNHPILIYEHYKKLFCVRKKTKTWLRNREKVFKMQNQIEADFQSTNIEQKAAKFNLIAPVINRFLSKNRINEKRQNKTLPENCTSWSVGTMKYADIDLPEPKMPEPDRYIEKLNSQLEKIQDTSIPPFSHLQCTIPTSILPSNAFGVDQWVKYFGLVGDNIGMEPPLPANIKEILQTTCPFWSNNLKKTDPMGPKNVEKTHVLLLIPKIVQKKLVDKMLTIQTLKELVKKPKEGKAMKNTSFLNNIMSEYEDTPIEASYWILITRKETKNKIWDHEKLPFPYRTPTPLEVAVAICMEYVTSGIKLCDPLTPPESLTNSDFLCLSFSGR